MKKLLCILTLAFFGLLLTPQQAQAQYYCSYGVAYGTSYTWQSGSSVYFYSSTELDYCAGLYYDPATWGRYSEGSWASENVRMLGEGYTEGYADWVPAEIAFNYGYPYHNQYYNTDTRHYVLEYYQQYYCFYSCGYYWYDPWGWGFAEGGGYGGPNYYGYGGAAYWEVRRRRLGDTWHTIQYHSSACQSGQQFDSNGNSCPIQTPTPTPTPTGPPKPTVTVDEVGFKADLKVKRFTNDDVIDLDDNVPVWVRGSSFNGEYPVAYKKDTKPTIFASINVAQASSSYPTASLRVKNGSTVLATVADVNVGSNGKVKVDNISFTGDLGDSSKVKQSMYTFSWEISFDGSSWTSLGTTGAHEVHWLYANPIGPEFKNADSAPTPSTTYSGLYDLALRHATAKTGDGLTDVDQIIEAVTKGVDADLPYNPGRLTPDRHPLSIYVDADPSQQCSDNVALLRGLLRSIGIDGTAKYYWGGNPSNKASHFFVRPGGSNYVSAQFPRDANDTGIPANPYFTFHSTLTAGSGKSFDPSYGKVEDSVSLIKAVNASGTCLSGTAANAAKVEDTALFTGPQLDFGYACGTTATLPRSATVVAQSVPASMDAGYTYDASVTLQNNGSNTWTQADLYRLGSQNPQDNWTWGLNRVELPASVPPGGQVTFNFYVTAPSYAGTYNFQWRMIHEGVEWFGDATPDIPVEVYPGYSCDPWQEQNCWQNGGSWDSGICQCYGGWYYPY